ncbi:hypothetical protein FPJ27_37035 (plasmid) [Burkholderia sp. MS455]|uniref:hypothetical protein n=1 Tax=Burkholderia sp. MS455 TaxID=2811788 RepID=UPI0019581726|nr:hypothetical protein [Burkholderia sp. MS455]QRR11812.1 hypothetical protein FPJ27_37035 [Burkholderia sp. MS455]
MDRASTETSPGTGPRYAANAEGGDLSTMRRRHFPHLPHNAAFFARARVTAPGWLRQHSSRRARWVDVCQLADAMTDPFVAALASRLPHLSSDIEARVSISLGATFAMFRGEADALDTSLRVLDQPVWRLSTTGAFVCEAAKGEPVLLVYTPPVRRGDLDERG